MTIDSTNLDGEQNNTAQPMDANGIKIINSSPDQKEESMRNFFKLEGRTLSAEEKMQMMKLYDKMHGSSFRSIFASDKMIRLIEYFGIAIKIFLIVGLISILFYIMKVWLGSGLLEIWL